MKRVFGALIAILLIAAWIPAVADEQKSPAAPPTEPKAKVMIPAGSTLHVRLGNTLTSKTNKSGDQFTATVTQPIVANGQEVVPAGSTVEGHVAFVKPAKRIKGKAEMRIVLDSILTPEDMKFPLSAGLQDTNAGECAKTKDDEGTIEGCGKSAKTVAKQAAIGAGVGAAGGLMVGMATRGGCDYYYGCYPSSGPGVGTDVMYGAGIGAGTALIFNLLKHEKDIILVQGSELTFVVNRTVDGALTPQPADSSSN